MKNEQSLLSEAKSICIIGENAKSVAAAMALTHFGVHVDLYTSSLSNTKFMRRYGFDVPLCEQWDTSVKLGLLNHSIFNLDTILDHTYEMYWIFLDQLPTKTEDDLLNRLKYCDKAIVFSGITNIGRIDSLAEQLQTQCVFYLPFVFLNQASIYLATIAPHLLLVGEKIPDTAIHNPVIKLFINNSYRYHIDTLKTIEFTRSSLMNLVSSKLSFVNEIARLADHCQVDMKDVEAILALDERVGKGFLTSGWGYGGSTLPKENAILCKQLKAAKLSTNLVNEVAAINKDQKELIFRKLWRYFNSYIQNKTVLIWGAGYKSGTGRTKGGAIHTLLPLLWSHDITTIVYDPLAKNELNEIYEGDKRLFFADKEIKSQTDDIFDKIDALIILNNLDDDHPNIAILNKYQIPVFDAKNLLSKAEIQQLTSYYTGIGR